MAGTRSQTIDALKGIAILIVMLGHVLSWNHMEDDYLYDAIKVIQMPLFILVSGYLCGIGRPVKTWADYGRVLKKRALAYLVPFFFWIILQHPLTEVSNIAETLFALDKGLWFLMTLFLLNLMTYTAQLAGALAGRLQKQVFWAVYLGLGALVVVETLLGWEFLSPGLTRLYLPFYLLGYLAGEHRGQMESIPVSVKGSVFGVSVVGLLILVIFYDLQDVGSLPLLLRQLAASVLGCYVIVYPVSWMKEGKARSFLAWLGGYTLEIYVLHFHFATILNQGKTYELYSWQGLIFVTASFAAMSLITAGIIAVTKKIPMLDFLLYGKRCTGTALHK